MFTLVTSPSLGSASVKYQIPDVISVADAERLCVYDKDVPWTDPIVSDLVEIIQTLFPRASTGGKAYCRVEADRKGKPWHVDTGTKGHMPWCCYSASVLITNPSTFHGGEFHFEGEPGILHYRTLVAFSTEHRHKVSANDGNRKVLLMFFSEDT